MCHNRCCKFTIKLGKTLLENFFFYRQTCANLFSFLFLDWHFLPVQVVPLNYTDEKIFFNTWESIRLE